MQVNDIHLPTSPGLCRCSVRAVLYIFRRCRILSRQRNFWVGFGLAWLHLIEVANYIIE